MTPQPTLQTPRLVLRPFRPADAAAVQHLAGARAIADTMVTIPHPLTRAQAAAWIAEAPAEWAAGTDASFAVVRKTEETLIGAASLRDIDPEHRQAELSFWVGEPWWGQGFTSEAVRRLVRFGFERLGLNRIYAHHMVRNPASGRVLAKAGMRPEGLLRQRVRKWGVYEDVVLQAVLRADGWDG